MPHDTIFVAILGMLFYLFVPQYFGYVAVALALWFGAPVMRVVWRTTENLRNIPAAKADKDDKDDKDENKAEDEQGDAQAEDEEDGDTTVLEVAKDQEIAGEQ
jgi:hypothetical protein